MTTPNRTLIKLAILCVAMQDAGAGATTPALASIMAAFPAVAPSTVMMIATIPSLLLAIIPPIYAKATEFLRKRTILYIATVCFLVGGVGPALFHPSVSAILAFRVLLGISNGIVIPMSVDLCVDFFQDQERQSMMGFVSSTAGVSGILFQLLGGYLAGIRWDYCFYAYAVSAIFFGMAILFLPEPSRKGGPVLADAGDDSGLPLSVYLVSLVFAFYYVLFYILITNAAIVIMGEGLGAPGQIGIAFSFLTLGSLITAALHGLLFRKIRFALLPISFILTGIGLLLCFLVKTLSSFTAGIFFIGLGMGMVVPATMAKVTGLVPFRKATRAICLGFFGMGVGAFLQPFIFDALLGAFHRAPGRFPFLLGALGALFGAVAYFLVDVSTRGGEVVEAPSPCSIPD